MVKAGSGFIKLPKYARLRMDKYTKIEKRRERALSFSLLF